jgi:hypothetical protein
MSVLLVRNMLFKNLMSTACFASLPGCDKDNYVKQHFEVQLHMWLVSIPFLMECLVKLCALTSRNIVTRNAYVGLVIHHHN